MTTSTTDPDTADDPFLAWLSEQDYYVRHDTVREQWPDAQFRSMQGVTSVMDDTGALQTPRRDWRKAYVRGSAVLAGADLDADADA